MVTWGRAKQPLRRVGRRAGDPTDDQESDLTIIREYQAGRLPLYHMDVYRLEAGGGQDLGLEEYFDGDGISVVEWAQFVADELPTEYLSLTFTRTATENERQLTVVPMERA